MKTEEAAEIPKRQAESKRQKSQEQVQEGGRAVLEWLPVRQLRSRRDTTVPDAEQLPSEDVVVVLESDGDHREVAGSQGKAGASPKVLQRRRTWRPTAEGAQQTMTPPSGSEGNEAEDAEGMDADDSTDAQSADAAQYDRGPIFAIGEFCRHLLVRPCQD